MHLQYNVFVMHQQGFFIGGGGVGNKPRPDKKFQIF